MKNESQPILASIASLFGRPTDEMCVPSTTGVALRPTKCAFSRCLVVVVVVFFAVGEKTKTGSAGN